jgi:hypothetical protein
MNFSHAAVLALIGWYLLIPPPPNNDYEQLAPKAPLSSWEQIDSYATLRQCRKDIERAMNADRSAETIGEFGLFRCVSSDDPRLKDVN